MTTTMLQTSAALCFAVAILLETMIVVFRFRKIARAIVNIAVLGSIFHASWIWDVLIRNRMTHVSFEALRFGELAGVIWVGLGILLSTLAWLYHDMHGDADQHGEPSTCRAFESEKSRTARETRELKRSGAVMARR